MTSLNGVILAVTATISLTMANHCDVTDTLNNQWVNVDQMKNDHDPRYLSETQVSSQEDCQKACCLIGKNSNFMETFGVAYDFRFPKTFKRGYMFID